MQHRTRWHGPRAKHDPKLCRNSSMEEGNDQARKIVIARAVERLDILLDDKESEFSIMMVSLGEFGRDVARAVRYCSELGLDRQCFHARPFTLQKTSQYDSDDDEQSESEAITKVAPLTGYRCKYCNMIWRIDTAQIPNFSDELQLKCSICRPWSSTDVNLLEKWDDQSCTLLYEMECVDCKVRCLCSKNYRPNTWACFSCGTKGGFRRPENTEVIW